ncbi:MAG: sigma-70 family RNA polymerase sigma factor [Candidatus Sericytochromatia bacterium]|nr:sigma-70 family RNA polymerase sigma factor [Candidatus Sericytochromatia bacterium]
MATFDTPSRHPARRLGTPGRRATRSHDVGRALTASLERAYFARIAAGGQDAAVARHELAAQAEGLIHKELRRYQFPGVDREELFQEAVLGLLKAIDGFDAGRGLRLSTYAVPLIRQAIDRRGGSLGRVVRLPSHVREELSRVRKAEAALRQAQGATPDEAAVAAAVGLTVAQVQRLRVWEAQAVSMDAPTGEDEGRTLGDTLAGDTGEAVDEALSRAAWGSWLAEALEGLSDRERLLLEHRFGLNGREELLLREVGEHLHVTRQRASQLEARALAKLRQRLAARRDGLPVF